MDHLLSKAIASENTIHDGGYDKIAEKLFSELRCDRLLLEYDSPRAGDFAPLRFVPKNKIVVLGLITTKQDAAKLSQVVQDMRRPHLYGASRTRIDGRLCCGHS